MDPIANQAFSHDSVKFVYQNADERVINQGIPPTKPFKLDPPEKSKRSKGEMGKNKQKEKYNHDL